MPGRSGLWVRPGHLEVMGNILPQNSSSRIKRRVFEFLWFFQKTFFQQSLFLKAFCLVIRSWQNIDRPWRCFNTSCSGLLSLSFVQLWPEIPAFASWQCNICSVNATSEEIKGREAKLLSSLQVVLQIHLFFSILFFLFNLYHPIC